jgi:hypothetical protein
MATIKEISTRELFDKQSIHPLFDRSRPDDTVVLYQFIKDCDNGAMVIGPDGNSSLMPVYAGTIHIGQYAGRYINRDWGTDCLHFIVYYQLRPVEKTFTRISMHTFLELDEVRVYDIGDIGREITPMVSPEQVAQKYFGNSDFSRFFSHANRSLFSR